MAIRFILHDAALANGVSDPLQAAQAFAAHNRVLEFWRVCGVLVLNGDSDPLLAAIASLPIRFRKRWKTALSSTNFRTTKKAFKSKFEFCDPNSLRELQGTVDLALMNGDEACVDFLEEGECSIIWSSHALEICRFDCVDQSKLRQKEAVLSKKPILVGDARAIVLKERFADLMLYAREVFIVDRYAGANLVASFRKGQKCGLTKFFGYLNMLQLQDQRKKVVSLYVSDKDVDSNTVRGALSAVIATKHNNIASLKLFVVDEKCFGKQSHDRFLRFDGLVLQIGIGICVLENDPCKTTTSCTLVADDEKVYEDVIENALRSACDSHQIL